MLSAVTAGRMWDVEVSEYLLRLVPPLDHRARALRDQRSSGAVKWGWWLTSCPLSMAVGISAAPSGGVAWTGSSWAGGLVPSATAGDAGGANRETQLPLCCACLEVNSRSNSTNPAPSRLNWL